MFPAGLSITKIPAGYCGGYGRAGMTITQSDAAAIQGKVKKYAG